MLGEADRVPMKLVIADGGSTDGTREIAHRLAAEDPRVVFLENLKRIQSAAVNLAVQRYGGAFEFLIRIDAHADYPPRYCERLLAEQAATGADSVVVSMIAKGEGAFQRAAAAAQNSVLGNGGSAHRRLGEGRFTDHGHHALMRISAYAQAGAYDETFTHNEDAELDYRLRALGFRIWLSGMPPVIYFPRSRPAALLRQYFNYGKGRARTLFKHKVRPKLRQSVPLAVAPALGLALLAPVHPVFALPAAAWAGLCTAYGIWIGIRQKEVSAMLSGFAAMLMHLGWSAGFLWAAARFLRQRTALAPVPAKLPRPASTLDRMTP
jgi:succinoglycan biosynthesis protein ExoA